MTVYKSDDPRMQPKAYVSDGKRLCQVLRVEGTGLPAQQKVWLEDCRDHAIVDGECVYHTFWIRPAVLLTEVWSRIYLAEHLDAGKVKTAT